MQTKVLAILVWIFSRVLYNLYFTSLLAPQGALLPNIWIESYHVNVYCGDLLRKSSCNKKSQRLFQGAHFYRVVWEKIFIVWCLREDFYCVVSVRRFLLCGVWEKMLRESFFYGGDEPAHYYTPAATMETHLSGQLHHHCLKNHCFPKLLSQPLSSLKTIIHRHQWPLVFLYSCSCWKSTNGSAALQYAGEQKPSSR